MNFKQSHQCNPIPIPAVTTALFFILPYFLRLTSPLKYVLFPFPPSKGFLSNSFCLRFYSPVRLFFIFHLKLLFCPYSHSILLGQRAFQVAFDNSSTHLCHWNNTKTYRIIILVWEDEWRRQSHNSKRLSFFFHWFIVHLGYYSN